MKFDEKQRKIQAKYRKQTRRSSDPKGSTIEVLILIIFCIVLFLLNTYFNAF